jgi:hypothetical protein
VPNIYEVAKSAGVSTATVSRVMSQPGMVSPETRQRVLQAVERLGYEPNAAAKNLRTLRTAKLLVTVPDISNPFFALIIQGIEDAAQRGGYSVLVGDTQHEEAREERYAMMLRRKEADGLIFLGHRLPREAATLAASSARGSASPACTSTTSRRRPRRWITSIASGTGASASSRAPSSARSAAIACEARPPAPRRKPPSATSS